MISSKRVLAVTLARGGSKAISNKNIVLVAGMPLLSYTTREALRSQYVDKYVVSTDSDEIARTAKELDAEVLMRPAELATDTASSGAALAHAVRKNPGYDYVVELMATNPLKTVEDIDACIEKLYATSAESVVSIVQVLDQHPSRIKYIMDDTLCDFFPETVESRRQDLLPKAYLRSGGIYAMTTRFLLATGQRYSKRSRPYVMQPHRVVNIDEPMDLLIAEGALNACAVSNSD